MKYISTRGDTDPKPFSEVLLMGLAPDGGLMLPEHYPQVSAQTLESWRGLSYPDLAFEVMRLFITDIPAADLRDIINRTYTEAAFGTKAITPVRTLCDGIKIEALSNGPTLAFKDMAMQFLGNAFEYVLQKEGKTLNILGATSGDTGSAAEYALRGKKGVNVFWSSASAILRSNVTSLRKLRSSKSKYPDRRIVGACWATNALNFVVHPYSSSSSCQILCFCVISS